MYVVQFHKDCASNGQFSAFFLKCIRTQGVMTANVRISTNRKLGCMFPFTYTFTYKRSYLLTVPRSFVFLCFGVDNEMSLRTQILLEKEPWASGVERQ